MRSITGWLVAALILVLAGGAFYVFALRSDPAEVTRDHQSVVTRVQQVGRLELMRYFIKDVYRKEIKGTILGYSSSLATTKVLVVVSGEAIGCVDLAKLKPESVVTEKDSLAITLPYPEVCIHRIDHQNSQVYDTEFSIVDRVYGNHAKIIDEAYREAEQQVLQTALKQGILEQSVVQARAFLTPLFAQLGFQRVSISVEPPPADTSRVAAPRLP